MDSLLIAPAYKTLCVNFVQKIWKQESAHPESGLCYTAPHSHQRQAGACGVNCSMFKSYRLFLIAAAISVPALCTADDTPDIEHGRSTFNTMCGVCHSVQMTGGPVEGPNLI